jgi:hypothetical protein
VKTGTYDDPADGIPDGDVGYLTFDAEGNTTNQGYQGVFFKWGSLVGISPAQTEVPESSGTMTNDFLPSTPVYIPTCNTGNLTSSTWKSPSTSLYTSVGWINVAEGMVENAAANIPYLDGRAAYAGTPHGRNNTFVTDDAQNDPTMMWANKRGDICRYLGATGVGPAGYRLPMSSELGSVNVNVNDSWDADPTNVPAGGGWIKGETAFPAHPDAGYSNGRADLLSTVQSDYFDDSKHSNRSGTKYGSAKNVTMGNVLLPASGYRRPNDGMLGYVGSHGIYWSGSAHSALYGHGLTFKVDQVIPNHAHYRSFGFPIRCVKN